MPEATGKASTKAKRKYNNSNYDRINLFIPKGKKDIIKNHATEHGESVNGFVNRAIDETIKRDTGEDIDL